MFANALAGPPGAASAFWRECHGQSWVTRHSAFAGELLHDTNCIPLLFHVDGCNHMRDADVHIWSFRSALVSEDMRPWLQKCYLGCVTAESVPTKCMREDAEEHVLRFLGWSLAQTNWPTVGFYGEALSPAQVGPISPWRLAFVGVSIDWMARRDSNRFKQHYGAMMVCEQCCARRVPASG